MSRTMTSDDEEPASRLTTSITSWQSAHPALNTSTLRLLDIPLSAFEFGRRKGHLGVNAKVNPRATARQQIRQQRPGL
jgi:hypothetical protein